MVFFRPVPEDVMQEQAWIEMLRRIPVPFHDGLVLSTATGVDVVMQTIVRIEDKFLILRGRPAGTNETGKIIIIPFSQIIYLALPGKPTEKQVQGIFGDLDFSFAAGPANVESNGSEPLDTKTDQAPDVETNGSSPAAPSGPPASPTKAMLLAKLRAKFAGENSMSARGK